MNKRENIYSLQGFGNVFRFTLRQTFKNKGYLVSFVIFVLCMTLMGPIQYLGQHAGQSAAEDGMSFDAVHAEVGDITIIDNSIVELTIDDVSKLYVDKADLDDDTPEAGILKEDITISNIFI